MKSIYMILTMQERNWFLPDNANLRENVHQEFFCSPHPETMMYLTEMYGAIPEATANLPVGKALCCFEGHCEIVSLLNRSATKHSQEK